MASCSQLVSLEGCTVRVTAGPAGIRCLELKPTAPPPDRPDESSPLLEEAVRQLRAYFAGKLFEFDLPLEMIGTDFQKRVWQSLLTIPYGETRSYAFIAEKLGNPRAARAVGAANGCNPIPIIVPCHRVIGTGGNLVGYGGGLSLKRLLLDLETQYHADRLRNAPTRRIVDNLLPNTMGV